MQSLYKKLYGTLTDAEGKDLENPDDPVAQNAPANFFRLLIARTASKIADRLSSPKTTLAWLLQSLGAPPLFTGLIVPLRESGSLLPQIFLSNYLKRFALRKWAWSLGSIIQGAMILGCAGVALTLEGTAAGIAIVSLVALYSLARGISSVSAKDVLGKTIPKSKRGQLNGWAGSASGLIAIGSASFLFISSSSEGTTHQYALYLLAASLLWWAAAAVNARVDEPKHQEASDGHSTTGLREQLGLLKTDAPFRHFLIVRALAIGSGLSTPYIIALAHKQLGGASLWLGVFIIADGLAAMLTSPLWGRAADRSSRRVLRTAMLAIFALLTLVIVYTLFFDENGGRAELFFPLILFLLAAAHAGVRVGRKTFVVDMAEGDQRTDYVAVGNTMIGILLVIAGLVTGLISLISVELALGIFAFCALAGAVYGRQLPEVSKA
jgi:MFS family permease